VCSRCATRNSVKETTHYFRCFSCLATSVSWQYVMTSSPGAAPSAPPAWARWRTQRVRPDRGYPCLQDLQWESSGLQHVCKHPTGFGRATDVPADCKHHQQVGATCGLAAVNNLITNCQAAAVSTEQMMNISKQLGQAETAIRDGVESVREAGEEHNVSELYATSSGGHFDVQTLQLAFGQAGFQMSYVPVQKLEDQSVSALFNLQEGITGYVVHRKDPMNPTMDHWFTIRQHTSGPSPRYFVQDSLYEKIFELTELEALEFLLNLAPGALFSVSHLSDKSGCP